MARTRDDVITLANYEAIFPAMPDCQMSRHRQAMRTIQSTQNELRDALTEASRRRDSAIHDGAHAGRQHNAAGIAEACQRGAAALADIEQLERQQRIGAEIWRQVSADQSAIEHSDRTYLAWKAECDNIRQTAFSLRQTHDPALSHQENERQRNRSFNGFVAEVVAGRT